MCQCQIRWIEKSPRSKNLSQAYIYCPAKLCFWCVHLVLGVNLFRGLRILDFQTTVFLTQGSELNMKSSRFWRLRTRNSLFNLQVLVAIWYVIRLNYAINFEPVANLATAWKHLVTSRTILVTLATVSVAISSLLYPSVAFWHILDFPFTWIP